MATRTQDRRGGTRRVGAASHVEVGTHDPIRPPDGTPNAGPTALRRSKEWPVLVLGAGPAGIGAGLALGETALVLEEGPSAGGLCRTIELDGAVFDWGGHSFHTPHPHVRNLVFGALDMYEQPRRAICYCGGSQVRYPFQAHFRDLADSTVASECAEGLQSADGGAAAQNFEEYVLGRYGAGIARHFLLPYNRKLWGDLRRLTTHWATERVAAPEGNEQTFAQHGGRRTPLQKETSVAYPARGGFDEIFQALARRLSSLRIGQRVVRIDPIRQCLFTEDGSTYRWQRIVSTLAVDRLLALLPDVPPRIRRAAHSLEALPLALVLVVVGHPVDTDLQRLYCAGDDIPAHKVAINHNSSPYLRSLPHHGIVAEVSTPAWDGQARETLVERVVGGLCRTGLIQSPAEVRCTRVLHVRRAYPVPSHGRDTAIGEVKRWLQDRKIESIGRFGEWAYINSDEALAQGLALGERLRSAGC